MIVIEAAGGQPTVWLDVDGRHDVRSGVDVVTSLTSQESADLTRAAIAAGIADIEAARQVAALDSDEATARAGQAAALATTAGTRATRSRAGLRRPRPPSQPSRPCSPGPWRTCRLSGPRSQPCTTGTSSS